ncbi:unnamed protein product [Acanthoscelides obtectus]|uniref:Uncharacterized protein n=1 Tax=Acanthoscelides obtectus TaxID=200917 RepID=A0A9P0L6Q4_ACAOB|nr:unnamed protein product [Acanthoscelides obtectus]CAK1652915.1 hypothetical protein AOBTE_LOCUS17967 [Acanthoscelides obtectus]
MNAHLLISLVMVIIVAAAPTKKESAFVAKILQNVPMDDRRRFIKEQLFAGYLKTESLDYRLEDDDTILLYRIFIKNSKEIHPQIGPLQTEICLPNGHCFDPSDSSIYP